MRVKGVIAYDGSCFEGFQRQKRTERTVTQAMENALASLGIHSPIVGSGRTDTGVHATGQVIHFDLPPYWEQQELGKLQTHLNGKLQAIRIKHLSPVRSDFHARYDARERIYRYLFTAPKRRTVFERKYVAELRIDDTDLLKRALGLFLGTHDFELFMKTGSDTRHYVRTIRKAYCIQRGRYRIIYFHADGFLRAQVRMMIHASIAVANREVTLEQLGEQIDGRKRHLTGLAPPEGLYLARVLY